MNAIKAHEFWIQDSHEEDRYQSCDTETETAAQSVDRCLFIWLMHSRLELMQLMHSLPFNVPPLKSL